jgi:type IV secretory pathway VirJ component
LFIFLVLPAPLFGINESIEKFGSFGELVLYSETKNPENVVLFVSGDGGWDLGVVDMAKSLASLNALVVGVDIRRYLESLNKTNTDCLYPASDFEALSQYIQKKLEFSSYRPPILVGYSSGATLVYATLAQSPANTFLGGMSLGFCPDLAVTKHFCKGGGGLLSKFNVKGTGIVFDPIAEIVSPWIAFQGTVDQVCNVNVTERYVGKVKNSSIVLLPNVGHGFSVQKNWMPQFRDSFNQLAAKKNNEKSKTHDESDKLNLQNTDYKVDNLPIIEVLAGKNVYDTFAFIVSGDGGWASIDKQLADVMVSKGFDVIGLDSLQYFWKPRSPNESALALENILRHYLTKLGKEKVILIGYSRGADILPFMVNRLPADLLERVNEIALLGLSADVVFEFRLTDWLGKKTHKDALPVQPEVEKLNGKKLLCFYGADEKDSLCPLLSKGIANIVKLPGGHHFGGNYELIANKIISETSIKTK